jgi:hypothetical protein
MAARTVIGKINGGINKGKDVSWEKADGFTAVYMDTVQVACIRDEQKPEDVLKSLQPKEV